MTDNSDEITANLQRAETSIKAAKDMIEKGYYDIAASRAYYAAFYAPALYCSNKILTQTNIAELSHQSIAYL